MTTESPVRFVGNAGLRKWPANEEGMVSASGNMAGQELGMLLKEHRFHGNWKDAVPSRSGSAPPSMEGSFAALGNLTGHHQTGLDGILSSSSNSELLAQEEQIRADPSYVAYYINNVNLNPRLPPPITSRENRHLAQHVSLSGDNRRLASFDDNNMGSLLPSRTSLSTHKEESEEDQSPTWVSSGNVGTNVGDLSGQLPSSSRNKSLVDLIQEDFPRTPSPVFSNQSRLSSHGPTEDVADSEARVSPLQDSSVAMNKLPESGVCGSNSTPAKHSADLIRNAELSERPSSSSETISGHHVDPNGEVNTNSGVPSVGSIDTELKRLSISKDNRTQHSKQPPPDNGLLPWGSTSQVQAAQSHGVHNPYNTVDRFPHGQPKPSQVDMKSVFQTAGITSPFYGTTTGYLTSVNPFFPNTQQPSIITPQYNLCGYAVNAPVLPSCVAGYSLPSATPMTLESPPSLNFNGTAGNVIPGVDLQHLYKFYGQLGMAVQSPFSDSFYIPCFQHPSAEAFGVTHQYDPASRSYDAQKGISSSAFSPEQRPQYVRGGNLNIPSPLKVGVSSPSYYGSPPNMGVLMQYPGSPLANLQLPGSPVASPTLSVRRNDNIRSPASSIRNTGAYSGWQGSRGRERIDDPKTYSYLEELKSNKARRFELSDVTGHIVEFSTDQHGSRFIQQKLETSTIDEKASVFKEVLPHASTLMTDVFGNYVIQKFFEHGSADQRKELANQLVGHILSLSLQMYGCRVIQKALEVIELDQKTLLVIELDGHVMRCVRDQNGNHVIQKCIECVPTDRIEFIISAFRGQVATLSTHPYGCRVIQRVLEHCTDELQTQCIVDEILQSACLLAQDQYGNYVTQHVLERGKPHERSQIISKLAGQIVLMSQHKFASNVIEKCLEYGDAAQRGLLIEEIVGQTEGNDDLLMMMKDQFANYVIQKILETCTDKQRAVLLSRIRIHLPALKKYTYGKHIVARVEQLSGEETSP